VSLILLAFSIYTRLKLNESPVFKRMKAEGKGSKAPLTESFLPLSQQQVRGARAARRHCRQGRGVVYGAVLRPVLPHHHAQARLCDGLCLDRPVARDRHAVLHCLRLAVGPHRTAQDHLGWLPDRGRHLLPAVRRLDPLRQSGAGGIRAEECDHGPRRPVDTCNFHIFVGPWSKFSDCDRAQDFLTKSGLSFKSVNTPGQPVAVQIGATKVEGWDSAKWQAALTAAGYPKAADPSQINYVMVELILVIMVLYVTMVYGPIAAFLVELFPTKIRYTSMSLPYHIGNGWFGGMLPLLATAVVAATGDIYAGLWYPIAVALM